MLYPESKKILRAMKTPPLKKGHPERPGWAPRDLIKAHAGIKDSHIFDDALRELVDAGILVVRSDRIYGDLYAFSMRGRHRLITFVNSTIGVIFTSVILPAVVALLTVLIERWLGAR